VEKGKRECAMGEGEGRVKERDRGKRVRGYNKYVLDEH